MSGLLAVLVVGVVVGAAVTGILLGRVNEARKHIVTLEVHHRAGNAYRNVVRDTARATAKHTSNGARHERGIHRDHSRRHRR